MPRRPTRKTIRLLLVLLCLASLWLGGLYGFTRNLLTAAPPPATAVADAVVVLTGGSNRLQTGFDLLEQGLGKKLFISGVYQGVEVRELLDLWKQDGAAGLDCCVVLGFEADNTVGNARETVQWMRQEKYTSLYLVTAHYHMRRALLDFRRADSDIRIIPYPVAPEGLDMKDWWRDSRYRSLIIREYNKYLAALALYPLPRSNQ